MNENMKKLFQQSSIHKNIILRFPGTGINNIENDGIYKDSLSLNESISDSKSLVFGTCNSAKFEITIDNTPEVVSGIPMTVSIQIEEYEHSLFTGVIDSVKVQSDKRYKKIIAYDALYQAGQRDVSGWYTGLTFPLTLKAFRNSLFNHLGIAQETTELVNDGMMVEKTIQPEKLYALTVMESICQINGVFGRMNGNGIFQYVFLKDDGEQIYPSNTLFPRNDIYPNEVSRESIKGVNYETCIFEDYTVQKINKLQIRQEENDIGIIVGDEHGDNPYIIEDNFLVYGKTHLQLQPIAENIFGIIKDVEYVPCKIDMQGLPYLQVGDQVKVYTNKSIFNTFILKRKLSGIQALKDAIDIKGEEFYGNEVKSLHEQIIQLKGKTNVLTRTVEETKSEIRDVEAGLTSSITQTADKIETEVTRATSAESLLSSRITQTANSISLKVSKGEVSSQLSIESGQVKISSNRFVLDSTNCKISADGTITATNGNFSGTITSNNAIITGGRINMYASGSDSGIMLVYGSDYTSVIGTGITVRNTYGSSTISGNSITSGGSMYVKDYLYVNNIRANTGTSVTFGDKVYFSQDTEFNIGKTHTMKGTINIDGEVKCGGSASYVGFFGNRGATRKSVSKLYSASETNNMNKINEIIDALKAYNLIG